MQYCPNITGDFTPFTGYGSGSQYNIWCSVHGCFVENFVTDWASRTLKSTEYGNSPVGAEFDAKRSSVVYGKSDIVQPQSLRTIAVVRT